MKKIIKNLISQKKENKKTEFLFIQNINRDPSMPNQKKAIMAYLTNPFELGYDFENSFHTNQIECIQILNILIEMKFSIDISHCLDNSNHEKVAKNKYDLIFGLGELFHKLCEINKEAIKILYCAEAHPAFLRRKEQERLDYFMERKGVVEKSRRTNTYYKEKYFTNVNNIIYKGNSYNKKSFSSLKNMNNILSISPAPFINNEYIYNKKNHIETKKNFIWFGSLGAIHKGLDILVDIFKNNKTINLFICGLDKTEEYLFTDLPKNVKNLGFVNINSKDYINLINNCSFVIMPSCCEGMSSGVITSMNHGLIPLITRECGIDLNEKDLYIDEFRIDYLEKKILKYSTLETQKLNTLNESIFKETRKKYSINNFKRQMKENIKLCINDIDK